MYETKERVLFKAGESPNLDADHEHLALPTDSTSPIRHLGMIDKAVENNTSSKITAEDLFGKTMEQLGSSKKKDIRRLNSSLTSNQTDQRKDHSPRYIYTMMSHESKLFSKAYPTMPKDFDIKADASIAIGDYNDEKMIRRLPINKKDSKNPQRRLGSKKISVKGQMEIRLGIIINNLKDEWNNGDSVGFNLAYPKGKDGKDLLKKILKLISCLDWKKTNNQKNADILYMVKGNKCLNMNDIKYKKMVEKLKKDI